MTPPTPDSDSRGHAVLSAWSDLWQDLLHITATSALLGPLVCTMYLLYWFALILVLLNMLLFWPKSFPTVRSPTTEVPYHLESSFRNKWACAVYWIYLATQCVVSNPRIMVCAHSHVDTRCLLLISSCGSFVSLRFGYLLLTPWGLNGSTSKIIATANFLQLSEVKRMIEVTLSL